MAGNALGNVLLFQGPLSGMLLAIAGIAKVFFRPAEIKRTGFAKLISAYLHEPSEAAISVCWMGLATAELSLAAWLLSGLQPALSGTTGICFGTLSLLYVLWLLRYQRSASCGCFSANTPVSWRTFARSCCLIAMMCAYTYVGFSASMAYSIAIPSLKVSTVLFAEIITIALLSDELRGFRRELKLTIASITYSLHAMITSQKSSLPDLAKSSWTEAFEQLERGGVTDPELLQSWRHGRWRLSEYRASWNEGSVAVIGAEYPGGNPEWSRIIVIDESESEPRILMVLDSTVARDLEMHVKVPTFDRLSLQTHKAVRAESQLNL